ncbi:hypothetical protein [Umezakia ovalisporum]|uniref:hypothetical protein n=1 Tax=Umezakia ovalisporum TaxID=75695 RepID=UPI00247683E5|nr:hypothetical protein [Umezakia ovalisporum]MDH6083977.1 hypothetical protein [Umezakia ovalisporum TAC611]
MTVLRLNFDTWLSWSLLLKLANKNNRKKIDLNSICERLCQIIPCNLMVEWRSIGLIINNKNLRLCRNDELDIKQIV